MNIAVSRMHVGGNHNQPAADIRMLFLNPGTDIRTAVKQTFQFIDQMPEVTFFPKGILAGQFQ